MNITYIKINDHKNENRVREKRERGTSRKNPVP